MTTSNQMRPFQIVYKRVIEHGMMKRSGNMGLRATLDRGEWEILSEKATF